MDPRRNPLSPTMEKAKKAELGKHSKFAEEHILDQIYGLAIGAQEDPSYFYVGLTNDPVRRWQDHLGGVRDPMNMKDAYIVWRDIGIDQVRMIVLDPTAEFSEAEWVAILSEQGHVLTNVASPVDVKRKKKSVKDIASAMTPLKKSPAFHKAMVGKLDWRSGWKK